MEKYKEDVKKIIKGTKPGAEELLPNPKRYLKEGGVEIGK